MDIVTEPARKKRKFSRGDSSLYDLPGVVPIVSDSGNNLPMDMSNPFIMPGFSVGFGNVRARSFPSNKNNPSGYFDSFDTYATFAMRPWNDGSHKKIRSGDILMIDSYGERSGDESFLSLCTLQTLEKKIQKDHRTIAENIQLALKFRVRGSNKQQENDFTKATSKVKENDMKNVLIFEKNMFHYKSNEFKAHSKKILEKNNTETIKKTLNGLEKFYDQITSITPASVWRQWKRCGVARTDGSYAMGKYKTSISVCTGGLSFVRKIFKERVASGSYLVAAIVYENYRPTIKLSHGLTIFNALQSLPRGELTYYDFVSGKLATYTQQYRIGKNCIVLGRFGNIPRINPISFVNQTQIGDSQQKTVYDDGVENPRIQFIL